MSAHTLETNSNRSRIGPQKSCGPIGPPSTNRHKIDSPSSPNSDVGDKSLPEINPVSRADDKAHFPVLELFFAHKERYSEKRYAKLPTLTSCDKIP